MSKPRSSLALEAARTSQRQKDGATLQKEFADGGWKLLDDMRTNDHFEGVFSSLCDRLAGNEKLFKFAGKSG